MNDWTWVTDPQYPTFCLVLFRDVTVNDVLETYGSKASATRLLHADEVPAAFPLDSPGSLVRCGSSGSWSFFFEDTGSRRTQREFIEGIGADQALRLVKNGDGSNIIESFSRGQRTEFFELTRPTEIYGSGPHILSARLAQAESETGKLRLDECFEIIGAHLGFSVPRNLLDGPLVTFFVPAP